jgi:2-polyprenyl-3-methyl-5-hydroxy-6-metoxy-1,4-benzoquinol methylase
MTTPQPTATYRPEIYEVETLEAAKRLIVTPEQGTTTEERWQKETAFLVDDIVRHLGIGADDWVLDYGCGVGRLSKALIDRTGCRVAGVDFSKSMRLFAPEYVLSERFTVWSPEVLAKMAQQGFRVRHAICLWVLQHVMRPQEIIQLIDSVLAPGAQLYVLNGKTRCVPTDRGYVNDGANIAALLQQSFEQLSTGNLPPEVTTAALSWHSHIQVLRKRAT